MQTQRKHLQLDVATVHRGPYQLASLTSAAASSDCSDMLEITFLCTNWHTQPNQQCHNSALDVGDLRLKKNFKYPLKVFNEEYYKI